MQNSYISYISLPFVNLTKMAQINNNDYINKIVNKYIIFAWCKSCAIIKNCQKLHFIKLFINYLQNKHFQRNKFQPSLLHIRYGFCLGMGHIRPCTKQLFLPAYKINWYNLIKINAKSPNLWKIVKMLSQISMKIIIILILLNNISH